jgi:hypothetical protein
LPSMTIAMIAPDHRPAKHETDCQDGRPISL